MIKTKEVDCEIIVTENKQKDLGNALMDLLSTSKKKKQKEDFYYGETIEEEKPKKKKKKKKSIAKDCDIEFIDEVMIVDEEIVNEPEEETGLVNLDSIIEHLDEEDDLETIIYDQKKSYKKNKKSDGYIKQFAEEITLLYGLLEESNEFNEGLDKLYKNMLKTSRGFNKSTTDVINSIISIKNTKLNVIKEINSVKKNIADLSLKESKMNGDNNDSQNNVNALAASYFSNIIKHGRNNFIVDVTQNTNNSVDEYIENMRIEEDNDTLNEDIMRSLESDSYRSEESNAYIANETKDVTVKVQHDVSSGDWEFVAIDKDGYVVEDYPVPSKDFVTPIKFSNDGLFVTDKFQRMYQVVEII